MGICYNKKINAKGVTNMKLEYLKDTIEKANNELLNLTKKSSSYSMIRLLCIVAFCFFLYQGYNRHAYLYIGACLILFIFLYIVRKHAVLKRDMEDLHAYIEVHEDIIKRKGNEWKQFEEQGVAYLNERTTQAYDLDIFGKASLYQYICVAKTTLGKDELASLLTYGKQQNSAILKRQEAVKECMQNTKFTLYMTSLLKLFEKHGKKKKKKSLEDFFQYMEEEERMYPKILQYVFLMISACTLVSLVLTMFFDVTYAYLLIFTTFSLVITFLSFLHNSAKLARVGDSAEMMRDYERMLESLHKEHFTSAYLMDVKQRVDNAGKGIRELNQILNFVRLRSNSIMSILMNAFFLLDFQCVFALAHWKRVYGKQVRIWLQSLASIEAILSLTQLGLVKDAYCMPVIEDEEPYFDVKDIKHPLLIEKNAIANSFKTKHGSIIITGSNMSGKTTFLRTIGMNLVLFHAGACVCASAFHAVSMNIFTSMRVQDDVSEGISTFYAEILRIKQMMQESDKKIPMLVLIDEIFKGTNSADRILCAKQAIVRLHLPWVITMVSTHDFELCDLEFDKKIQAVNYHFSEYYEGDKICFDYTLKDGRCTTTNARQLMKLAGF